jgi:hypothetical protein
MIAAGMKNGEIRRGPPVDQLGVLALDGRESADAAADEDAHALGLLAGESEIRVLDRVLRWRPPPAG